MTAQTTLALAAALALAGAVSASAASSSPMAASAAKTATAAPKPSDSLSLSSEQQRTAWRDLNRPALDQFGPSGFIVSEGAVLPESITTEAIPNEVAHAIPALWPYVFAMVQHQVVIVNPSDRKIAEVISG